MSRTKDPTDTRLVQAAQAGDVAALGVLLQRHRAPMTAIAVALLGHHADVEDAVQDACIQAMRKIGDVREPEKVRTWLIAIVANNCRARLRRPRTEVPRQEVPARGPGDLDELVDRRFEECAVRDWVQSALDRLPVPLRTAVLLRYFSDAASYEAIATLCEVPVGTVRSRLHAARARLAQELLSMAATAPQPIRSHHRLAEQASLGLAALQATGEAKSLADCFASDLRFTLADGVEQQGRERFAALLAADFDDGLRARPVRLTAGSDVAVLELRLDNPSDQPLHCPSGLTQLHLHDGRRVQRVSSHYASVSRAEVPPDRRGIDHDDRDAREAEELRPGVP